MATALRLRPVLVQAMWAAALITIYLSSYTSLVAALKTAPPPPPPSAQTVDLTAGDYTELMQAAERVNATWADPANRVRFTITLAAATFSMEDIAVFEFERPNDGSARALTMQGAGAVATVLDCGGQVDTALQFNSAVNLSISGIHFTRCMGTSLVLSDLHVAPAPTDPTAVAVITDCSFTHNTAFACLIGAAGGIASNGLFSSVSISRCSFDQNVCMPQAPLGDSPPEASGPPPFAGTPPARRRLLQATPPGSGDDASPPLFADYPPYSPPAVCGCASSMALYTVDFVNITACNFTNGQNDGDAARQQSSSAVNIASLTGGVSISGTRFVNNTCKFTCTTGALFLASKKSTSIYPENFNGTIKVTGSSFRDNYADCRGATDPGAAGAAFLNDIPGKFRVIVDDCDFHNNTLVGGVQGAGALCMFSVLRLDMTMCTFSANVVSDVYNGSTAGAALTSIGQVHMDECSFLGNTAQRGDRSTSGVAISKCDVLSVANCLFGRNDAGVVGYGALAVLDTLNAAVVDTRFIGNTADTNQSVAAVYAYTDASNSTMLLKNCSFEENSSEGSRGIGAVWISYLHNATLEGCTFNSNFARGRTWELTDKEIYEDIAFAGSAGGIGALQFVKMTGTLVLKDVLFKNNTCPGFDGSGAVFIYNMVGTVEVDNGTFIRNSAPFSSEGGAIAILDVQDMFIHESVFENNTAGCNSDVWLQLDAPRTCGGGAFSAVQSSVFVVNTSFTGNMAVNGRTFGGAILLQSNSRLLAIGNNFTRNVAAAGGAIYSLAGSEVRIDTPIEQNDCICSEDVPLAVGLQEQFPDLFSKYFNRNVLLPLLGASLFEENVAFSGGAIAATNSLLSISFVEATQCTCNRTKTSFINNRAYSGGAITSQRNLGATDIVNTIMRGNTATGPSTNGTVPQALVNSLPFKNDMLQFLSCGLGHGGAICLTCIERCSGAIANSVIEDNTAFYGGGLYATADELQCADPDNCYTIFVTGLEEYTAGFFIHKSASAGVVVPGTQTQFVRNVVSGGAGGAMYLEHYKVVDVLCDAGKNTTMMNGYNSTSVMQYLPCNGWIGNEATNGAFGSQVASTPVTFTSPLLFEPYQYSLRDGSVFYSSGDPLVFNVSVWDMFGQEHVTREVNSKAVVIMTILVNETNVGTTVVQIEAASIPGRLPTNVTSLIFRAATGDRTVRITAVALPLNRRLESAALNVFVRPCKIGEFDPEGFYCLPCDVGTFNVDPGELTQGCQSCPDGASCVNDTSVRPSANNSIIAPDSNNYNSNPYSTQIYNCAWNGKACDYEGREEAVFAYQSRLVSDPSIYNATEYNAVMCNPGHTGVLCGTCLDGYGQAFTSCQKCIDFTRNVIFYSLVTIAFTLPLFFLLRAANTTSAAAIHVAEDEASAGMSKRQNLHTMTTHQRFQEFGSNRTWHDSGAPWPGDLPSGSGAPLSPGRHRSNTIPARTGGMYIPSRTELQNQVGGPELAGIPEQGGFSEEQDMGEQQQVQQGGFTKHNPFGPAPPPNGANRGPGRQQSLGSHAGRRVAPIIGGAIGEAVEQAPASDPLLKMASSRSIVREQLEASDYLNRGVVAVKPSFMGW